MTRHFVTLGLFIIDEFEYLDEQGNLIGRTQEPQGEEARMQLLAHESGMSYELTHRDTSVFIPRLLPSHHGTMRLPPDKIGMIIDRGTDFPQNIQDTLNSYGEDMWMYRDNPERVTARAVNKYRGDDRGFNYITSRRRLTPADIRNTHFERPTNLHFICSPSRAREIISEVLSTPGWAPITICEPIPDRCVPEELPALIVVLPHIDILSPNAEEALSLLSMQLPPTKETIEEACAKLLQLGVGPYGKGHVVIRSGALGAYVASRTNSGRWISAYWSDANKERIVDVTGAGNSFLGGLSAGLLLTKGDVSEAVLYASISASFTIEQLGLPKLAMADEGMELWNGDSPARRLQELRARHSA